MALRVTDGCIGCGVCEAACPRQAISQQAGYLVTYGIDPLRCNDCGDCVARCALEAIETDPAWAACRGRGCPLTSRRYGGVLCTEGDPEEACPSCGGSLWQAPGDAWRCPRCESGERGGTGTQCPKARRAALA